jgi:IS4 transposase
VSEIVLAGPVIDRADATMLVTADCDFFNYSFWQRAAASGAKLLFRARTDQKLPREKELADGSYLTTLHACDKDRRHQVDGAVVRVIEYFLDGIPDPEPSCRLVTNWLDIDAAPGVELAALYHRRWTIEQCFDELKVHLATRDVLLRSKRPELVEQEFYALLLAHAAIRRLIRQAAVTADQVAEDLSLVHVVVTRAVSNER